jgi:hypothetical protein
MARNRIAIGSQNRPHVKPTPDSLKMGVWLGAWTRLQVLTDWDAKWLEQGLRVKILVICRPAKNDRVYLSHEGRCRNMAGDADCIMRRGHWRVQYRLSGSGMPCHRLATLAAFPETE